MKMKYLIDNRTPISTTRWAFVVCIRSAIILAFIVLFAVILGVLLGKPMPDGFLGGASALIGVLAGVPTTAKALQGFETKHNDDESKQELEK